MAEQRRYQPTQAQQNRIAYGGERPSDQTWYSRLLSNAAATLPLSIAGAAELPELVKSAAVGAWNSGPYNKDTSFGQEFARSMYGDAGLTDIAAVKQREMKRYTDNLTPAELANPEVMKAIDAAVEGSRVMYEAQTKHRMPLSQWSEDRQNWISKEYGLPPVYEQTTGDELTQIATGLLLPTPDKLLKIGKLGNMGVRAAARGLEWLLPGSSGVRNAAANAAVQTGVNQGLRYAGDLPNIATGEAFVTDYGVGYKGVPGVSESATGPVTSSNTPPSAQRRIAPASVTPAPQEDASASLPFGSANDPTWNLPFQYKVGTISQSPSAESKPVVTRAPPPDSDPANGGSHGSWWYTAAAGVGTIGLIAATMRGKHALSPPARQIVQDVDSPNAAARMEPTPTDHIELEPTLSRRQRARAGAQKSTAIEASARNALEREGLSAPDIEVKTAIISREVDAASRMEVSNALHRTVNSGELPFINRRIPALNEVRAFRDKEYAPEDQELLQKYATYADRGDRFKTETDSLEAQLTDKQLRLRSVTAPKQTQTISDEIADLHVRIDARKRPDALVSGTVSAQEIANIKMAAMNNPKVKRVLDAFYDIRDGADEAMLKSGGTSQAYLDAQRKLRPNFLPLNKNDYAGMSDWAATVARTKAALKGRHEPGEWTGGPSHTMYSGKRSAHRTNLDTDRLSHEGVKDIFDSMETALFEVHRQIRRDAAAKSYVQTVLGTNEWGRTIQRAHEPVPIQDWERKNPALDELKRDPRVFVYNENGQVHIFRAADAEVARAMRHNPSSTIAVMDAWRKVSQWFLTGPGAPWFAPVAASFERGVARATLASHYGKGIINSYLKRVFPEYHKTIDLVGDPTLRLQEFSGAWQWISARAIDKAAEVLGDRIATHSSLIAQSGNAKPAANAMIRRINDMRMRMQFFENTGIIGRTPRVVEDNEAIWKNIKLVQSMIDVTRLRPVARALWDGYLALADAIRNAPRIAIASQNLERLLQKHKGNIPNDVLRAFIKDMKYMSGDMTKAIGSNTLASIASAAPFGQNTIHSTLHVVDRAMESPYMATRVMTNFVLPKVVWTMALTAWIGKEFEEEFWDRMPAWEQERSIPMVSPDYLMEITTGEYRPPTMKDVIMMRQAPEGVAFAETAMSGFRALGWFGTHAQNTEVWQDAFNGLTSFLPAGLPLYEAIGAFTEKGSSASKYQGPGLSNDSDSARMWMDAAGAIFGGSVDVVGAGLEAGADNWYRGGTAIGSVWDSLLFTAESVKQKLPDEVRAPLFGGQRRHYTRGQARERNLDNFEKIGQLENQLNEQMSDIKSKLGPDTVPDTRDPAALRMIREMQTVANSGVMDSLRGKRSDRYKQLERLDLNKSKHSLSEYTRISEALKREIQTLDIQEQEQFQRLNNRLRGDYGALGVTDIDSAIEYVRGTIQRR